MSDAPSRAELNGERAFPGSHSLHRMAARIPEGLAALRRDGRPYHPAVVIPKAMAYATIAGLPVQVGLYTAFLPVLIYAVFGTSRPLSVSTTTTIAILTGAQIGQIASAGDPASLLGASAMLTLLVGAVLVLASFLRLGFVANFISEPVLIGFKAGIGLVIVLDQVPKLLGIHFQKGGFVHNLLAIVQAIPDTSAATLAVGALTIALLVATERLCPRAPAALIAVAVGIAGVGVFGLQAHGVEFVGQIPGASHPLPGPTSPLPHCSGPPPWHCADELHRDDRRRTRVRDERGAASPGEPGVACDGPCECGRRAAGRHAGGGGTSQTAVNRLAGARTQVRRLSRREPRW